MAAKFWPPAGIMSRTCVKLKREGGVDLQFMRKKQTGRKSMLTNIMRTMAVFFAARWFTRMLRG